jgi:hypothetical protein
MPKEIRPEDKLPFADRSVFGESPAVGGFEITELALQIRTVEVERKIKPPRFFPYKKTPFHFNI